MAKYIDADKIIDYANEEVTGVFCYPQGQRKLDEDAHRDRWAFVREVMIVAPAVDVAPRWIPVTERLPEEDKEVLISYRYKEGEGNTSHSKIDITSYGQMYFGGQKVGRVKHWRAPFEFFESNYEVIAWMPLPAPYKGGGQNE